MIDFSQLFILCKQASRQFSSGEITIRKFKLGLLVIDEKELSCKQQMEMICLCQDAKTRLCHNCLITHLATNPNITHSIEPSIADSLTDDPQDMQKYLERKKIIDYLVVEASSNFSVLEKYKEKVYKAKELILECLEKTVEEAIKKADQIKEDVEKIISYLEGKKFTQNSNDD